MAGRVERRGISFPLEVGEDGGLKVSEDADLIRDRIFSVLLTRKLERPFWARYGTQEHIFESRPTVRPIVEGIKRSLEAHIPEVSQFEVLVNTDTDKPSPKTFNVRINYTLAGVPQSPVDFDLSD
jgi:hypothetical protein